ncbi:hypothetical protein DJ564_19380 [Pseudomonas sp. 31-12]|uniref:hypothetical protein n=1 Tax=Pseudomonas sp. 31-12 TaxID=2201356 RepID=UPI000D6D860B|nr:hypothetical protein [Pseudomonas sp. 31-12]AWM92809.1 hypothetical protein DJ564_19380 [Pseudomonas sp. 31-12]
MKFSVKDPTGRQSLINSGSLERSGLDLHQVSTPLLKLNDIKGYARLTKTADSGFPRSSITSAID